MHFFTPDPWTKLALNRGPLNRKGDSLIGNGPICTDIVFIGLCKASPFFRNIILNSELTKKMDYVNHGGASFMDLVRLNKHVPRALRYYPLADLTGDHMEAGSTDNRSKFVSEPRNKNIAAVQHDLAQDDVSLRETPALRALDKDLEGAKTLPDKIERFPAVLKKLHFPCWTGSTPSYRIKGWLNCLHWSSWRKVMQQIASLRASLVHLRREECGSIYSEKHDRGDDTNVVFEENVFLISGTNVWPLLPATKR